MDTTITITLINCLTLIALALIGTGKGDKK